MSRKRYRQRHIFWRLSIFEMLGRVGKRPWVCTSLRSCREESGLGSREKTRGAQGECSTHCGGFAVLFSITVSNNISVPVPRR